jgi:MoaA/NifB/PqqE/SkfB family radical SAM enzyme
MAFPSRVSVEVTNRCNQACRLCPRDRFTRPLGLMERSMFERVAEECAPHGTALWLHFLGEPLLHPALIHMIRFAKAVGVRQVGLSTNGTLLTDDVTDRLLASGLDRLECSLDADDREGYRAMRGSDDFDRVVANVEGFLRRKRAAGSTRPVTSIQFMRTPEVEAKLADLVGRWDPLLADEDFVMTIVPAPFAGAVLEADGPGASADRPPCPWLFTSLMVLQDGTVTMCGADWDAQAPVGHVADASLGEIWHGAELERRRDAHRRGCFGEVDLCGPCTDWHLADGHGYVNASEELRTGPVPVSLSRR